MQILAVMVRHKTPLEDSQTVTSLGQSFAENPELLSSIQVLIWDNSSEPLENPQLPFPMLYQHSGENVGLSGAFNSAAAFAQENGIPWLLLFDQDTTLPGGFLTQVLGHALKLEPSREIAAVVPTVYVGDFVVSPRRMLFNRHRAYPEGQDGICEGEAAAINSGTLLRVKDLLGIGGYSSAFWLDYSDWYVFHKLFLQKKRVWWASDIKLQHSMTVMDYDNLMTVSRYKNYIAAEGAYNDLFKGPLENSVQTLRLFARVIRQYRRFKNPEFSRITRQYLFARLFASRKTRIKRWELLSALRNSGVRGPA